MSDGFFTADQIVAHLVGDYLLQSHWMATNKISRDWPARVHAVVYTLPFVLITQSWLALAIICGSHFLIDRYRLARFVVWFKNGTWMRPLKAVYCGGCVQPDALTPTGYPADVPPWLAVWLLIIADNTIHVLINGAAIALGRTW